MIFPSVQLSREACDIFVFLPNWRLSDSEVLRDHKCIEHAIIVS